MTRLLPLVLFSTAASAGTIVTWERVKGGEPPTTLTLKCEGANARFDGTTPNAGPHAVIWDAPKKTLNMLRLKDKTYSQVTEAQIAEMRARGKQMMEQMKEKMASMPPEQRAQAEAMMATAGIGDEQPAEWTFKATGKKTKVGKWDCEIHEGDRNGFKTDFCLVPWAAAPAKKEELECVKALSQMFSQLTRGMAKDGDGSQEDLTKFPGMPVQTSRTDGAGKKFVSTVKSIERGAKIAPDQFVVPADYKLVRPGETMSVGQPAE